MLSESQNIEYKESWGRGFKKIREEFERAKMPLPVIEEKGGGVMAVIKRKTVEDVIKEREGNVGNDSGNVGNMSETNVGDMSETNVGDDIRNKLSERQKVIVFMIKANPKISARQMSETLSVTSRTIERDLAVMQKAKIIRREGTDSHGIWVVLDKINKGK